MLYLSQTLRMPACVACGKDNPGEARFCLFCGTSLARGCASCGSEIPEGAGFCPSCGTSAAAAAAGDLRAEEERKLVSVMFVDLVGFTARAQYADPEDVRATLRPYHTLLKEEIERFGGTVEKFVGDAVMAVFGAPVTHEDDAERAVRAGLRILEAIEELNEAQPQLELAVRAAVNTGEALVALGAHPERGEGFVTGDVVNTASRLQGVAPVGGLVVGELTYHATSNSIGYQELEPVSVKGKTKAIPIWQAAGARSRFGVDVEQTERAPLIGRDDELALLQGTYRRALRESSLQLVTLVGEPGVGKSRLVREFFAFIDDQPELVSWRQGRCLPYGEGITFWALGEIVKAQAGILESDSPQEAMEKLESAIAAVILEPAERTWLRATLAPLVGAQESSAAAAQREESFAGWGRFLEAIAAQGPLVLVFEDLHWADLALLEFIEHLTDWSSGVPLFLLCTARPELYELEAGWAGGKRNATTISLSPLTNDETASLIAALLSQPALPAETQTALLERCGGNPLYAEEFVRMLVDRGILARRGQVYTVVSEQDVPLPETIQALVAARLDTLSADRKALLHDAAVIGKVFWAGALASMGRLDPSVVHDGLQELARKELVRRSRTSSVAGDSEYAFWHAIVRDVAYAQIPRAGRARKHAAAAKWIEQMAGERIADQAELLAHHYTEALELARASGAAELARELEAPALRLLTLAGERALQLDLGKAEHYFARALLLAPAGSAARRRLLLEQGSLAHLAGRLAEAQRTFEDVIREARASDDLALAGEAMFRAHFPLWESGKTAEAEAMQLEATELLEREPPTPLLVKAYVNAALSCALAGDADLGVEWAERARALAETLGDETGNVQAVSTRGLCRFELGDLGGLADLAAGAERSAELGATRDSVMSHGNLAGALWLAEGPARALEVSRPAIARGLERGFHQPAEWLRGESLWMLHDLGDWDQLLSVADEITAAAAAEGGSQPGVIASTYAAQVRVRRGAVAEARDLCERFLPAAREIEELQVLVPALAVGGLVEQALGNNAEAAQLVRELEQATQGRSFWRARCLPDAVRIALSANDVALATALLDGAESAIPRNAHSLLSAQAVLAEARGELERARALYGEAATRWSEFGFALEQGQALFGAGRCLLALGAVPEATVELTAAQALFDQLGTRPLAAETGLLLSRAVARSA